MLNKKLYCAFATAKVILFFETCKKKGQNVEFYPFFVNLSQVSTKNEHELHE